MQKKHKKRNGCKENTQIACKIHTFQDFQKHFTSSGVFWCRKKSKSKSNTTEKQMKQKKMQSFVGKVFLKK